MRKQGAQLLTVFMVMLAFLCLEVRAQNIVGFSPSTISAGTGSKLTITGSGFGAGPASSTRYVEFANADNGGSSGVRPQTSDYISWSDTKIEVNVPTKAGIGEIVVSNGTATGSSTAKLNVTFNLINAGTKPARHVNKNTTGGYTFQLEKKFNDIAAVRNAFVKSVNSWTCLTGINWTIGETTATDNEGRDGVNVVRFDKGEELPAGVLGVAYTYSTSCGAGNWEIVETDLVFDGEQSWHYEDNGLPANKFDFQSVALHELGHAHNLGHVIDQSDLMNFSVGRGVSRRTLSANNHSGGDYQLAFSTQAGGAGCSGPMIKHTPGSCNFAFPTISGMSPDHGGEGKLVQISGEAFTGTSSVSFGGTEAASFKVISDKRIDAMVGKGASGELAVSTPGGTVVFGTFRFAPAPVITSFFPHFGATGDTILISGSSFQNVDSLTFGGIAAASYEVVDEKTIRAVVSTGASGAVAMVSEGGRISAPGFEFITKLTISSFSPKRAAAGDTIWIKGAGLKSIKAVRFGGTPAAKFMLLDSTSLYAVVGEGSAGSVQIESDYGKAESVGFEYLPSPEISSFSPAIAGEGWTVRIYGVNFTGVTSVHFGDVPAKEFVVTSPTIITALVGKARSGDVVVRSEGGTGKRAGFEFLEVLEIRSFSPKIATTGNKVVITGSRFRKVTDVTFGGRSAISFTVDSPEQITAIVGPGSSGNVSVLTADGVISVPGFNFQLPPTITFFTPASTGLGSLVTINGTNFQNTTEVLFGGVAAASFKVLSATSIEARLFSGSSGSIVVRTPVGEAKIAGFRFVAPPLIMAVDPPAGGAGATLHIRGRNLSDTKILRIGSLDITSYKIESDSLIIVALPAGVTDGKITLISLGGTVESSLFRFVPAPVIQAFTPQTVIPGLTISITGNNLSDITQVMLGGKPAQSFTLTSPTSITAVVASNSASGSVEVSGPGGKAALHGLTFNFLLPADNFRISATDVTCMGSNTGVMKIESVRVMQFIATVVGRGSSTTYSFTSVLELQNYSAGEYSVCITSKEQPSFRQCFDITIKQPAELALMTAMSAMGNTVDLRMEGGESYLVDFNGKTFTTSTGELKLSLKPGVNRIRLSTNVVCQGVIERTINVSDKPVIFPNPFIDVLNIQFPHMGSGLYAAEIRDLSGKVRSLTQNLRSEDLARLDLSHLEAGHYVLLISQGNFKSIHKIMKRN